MPENDIFKPNRRGKNFSVELYVGQQQITKFIKRVRLSNSIYASWPQVMIDMNIDSDEIVLGNIYGSKELTLVIYISAEETTLVERTVYHLLYIESNVNLVPKLEDSSQQDDRAPVTFSAVPLYSVNVMGAFVNYVIDEDVAHSTLGGTQDPLSLLETLVSSEMGFKKYDIDGRGRNETLFDQLVLPPQSLNQTIDYLNTRFRLYNGSMFKFCDHTGKLMIWDLRERLNDTPVMIIHQVPSASKSKTEFDKLLVKSLDGRNMITRDVVETLHHGNHNILQHGYSNGYITHPTNNLYRLYADNADDISNRDSVTFHPSLKARKKYYHSSSDDDRSILTSHMASNYRRVTRLKLSLRRNIQFKNVMKIGEPVEFRPSTFEYQTYRGKYTLETSDYILSRQDTDNWDAVCMLTMFRTNIIDQAAKGIFLS